MKYTHTSVHLFSSDKCCCTLTFKYNLQAWRKGLNQYNILGEKCWWWVCLLESRMWGKRKGPLKNFGAERTIATTNIIVRYLLWSSTEQNVNVWKQQLATVYSAMMYCNNFPQPGTFQVWEMLKMLTVLGSCTLVLYICREQYPSHKNNPLKVDPSFKVRHLSQDRMVAGRPLVPLLP